MALELLVLSTWFPYPPDNGSRLRAFHLIRELSKRHRLRLVAGVQPDIAGTLNAETPEALRALCDEVVPVASRWYTPSRRGAWRSMVSLAPRSIVENDNLPLRAAIAAQLQKPTDAVVVLELGMVPSVGPTTLPLVVDQVEVSGLESPHRTVQPAARLRRALTRWKSHRYWRQSLRRYRAVTAVSEEEATAVRRMLGALRDPPPVCVVPNGVEVGAYQRASGKALPGRMLYNGALGYSPNLDAVRWFAQEVLPRVVDHVPEAHLMVTGRNEGLSIEDLRANPRIHLTGFLPDLRPTLDTAALCVVPLRAGGGTRLKVLEAWAAGLPVVSTTLGAAGLGACDGKQAVLADTPQAMADAVARLLQHPEQAQTLAHHARRLVEERYDWTVIVDGLSDLLEAAANKKT